MRTSLIIFGAAFVLIFQMSTRINSAEGAVLRGNIIGGDNIHAIGEADVSKNPHNKPPISGSSKPAETPQVPAAESDTDEVDDNFSDEDSEGGYGENEDENDLNEEGGENVPDSYPLVQK